MRKSFAASMLAAWSLALAVFAGAAFAGNGNGNGNDGGAPGNSENAPGQVKQESAPPPASEPAPAPAPQTQQQPSPAQQASPGRAKQASASSSSSSGLPGIKPGSTTHGHKNATERADSGKTKKYGNGNTAGNIAISRGAAPSTPLYGPGNSQPHKVYDCRKRHWVDVHAVKSYASQDCTPTQPKQQPAAAAAAAAPASTCEYTTTTTSENVIKGIVHHTGSATNPTVVLKYNAQSAHARGKHGDATLLVETVTKTTRTPTGAGCGAPVVTTSVAQHEEPLTRAANGAAAAVAAPVPVPATTGGTAAAAHSVAATRDVAAAHAASAKPQGGVLGVQATIPPKAQPHRVLGTTARVDSSRLPFTGAALWIFVAAAAALVAAGYTLRRAGRDAL
jgi:hypothetical protein